jgi:hypothetical protein
MRRRSGQQQEAQKEGVYFIHVYEGVRGFRACAGGKACATTKVNADKLANKQIDLGRKSDGRAKTFLTGLQDGEAIRFSHPVDPLHPVKSPQFRNFEVALSARGLNVAWSVMV